jgi:8-oxo-dGTP pyrophosphatase MutT (NUDIX family)
MMNFQDAMREATEELGCDPVVINAGECGDWAELVCQLFPGAHQLTMQYREDTGDHDCYHSFVAYRGKYYDAETPQGVESPELFPIVVRADEEEWENG